MKEEIQYSKEHKDKKESLYYKKLDVFEKQWDALGRKLVTSEKIRHFRKDNTRQPEIHMEYQRDVNDLIDFLGRNMFEPGIVHRHISQSKTPLNDETAFEQFKEKNLYNSKYVDKYVVFVDGVLQDVGNNEVELVKKMHEKFGNIDMYVGKVSQKIRSGMIESPEI